MTGEGYFTIAALIFAVLVAVIGAVSKDDKSVVFPLTVIAVVVSAAWIILLPLTAIALPFLGVFFLGRRFLSPLLNRIVKKQ